MTLASREERLASAYGQEIWPLVGERAARLLLRALPTTWAHARPRVLEVGCAAGQLTREVARHLGPAGHVLALDPSAPMIAVAEAAGRPRAPEGPKGQPAAVRSAEMSFAVGGVPAALARCRGECDGVYSNLALADEPDPGRVLPELARCLRPGGILLATFPVEGSWAEPLDILGDVLRAHDKREAQGALASHEGRIPSPARVASWFEGAGLTDIRLETSTWELLFGSAREFFFAPAVELGPLPRWQQIAGGRGDDMQDVFFLVKEAIEAYFADTPFAVTMRVTCARGRRA